MKILRLKRIFLILFLLGHVFAFKAAFGCEPFHVSIFECLALPSDSSSQQIEEGVRVLENKLRTPNDDLASAALKIARLRKLHELYLNVEAIQLSARSRDKDGAKSQLTPKKICIFGPESTGKSTLAKNLARHFDSAYVPEFARTQIESKNGAITLEDIPVIARGQKVLEDSLTKIGGRVLFSDTDLLTTTIWSRWLFGSVPDEVQQEAEKQKYDLYLVTDVDVPWVPDLVRYLPQERESFRDKCIEELKKRGRDYVLLQGSWEKRMQDAVRAVEKVMGDSRQSDSFKSLYVNHVNRDLSPFTREDFTFQYPLEIRQALENRAFSEALRTETLDRCKEYPPYLEAMKNLEASVARVALTTPFALNQLRDLNLRRLHLLSASISVSRSLGHETRSQSIPKKEEVDAAVDQVLVEFFGACGIDDMGCVGKNPQVIREVFDIGNIRERLWFYSDIAFSTLEKIIFSLENSTDCSSRAEAVMSRLAFQIWYAPSKIEKMKSAYLLKCQEMQESGQFHIKGRYAYFNRSFKESRSEPLGDVFEVKSLTVPLSTRERNYLAEQKETREWIDFWKTGQSLLKPKDVPAAQPHHPDPGNYYYSTAADLGFPLVAASSGTLDMVLTEAVSLGMSSKAELEALRLAVLGFMVGHRHHSAYEILVSGNSFEGLPMRLNSDWYRTLVSDPGEKVLFEERVVQDYSAFYPEKKLPTQEFRKCIVGFNKEN